MTFSVDPPALGGYSNLLARARDDAQQCKAYFAGNVPDLSPGIDGLINPICYEHVAVRQKLSEMLDQMVALLDSSRDEMAAAATRYRQTDAKAAATVDKAYPEVPRAQPRRD
ncbi:hypothetical protein [Actinoplanes sp. NPDC049118]|uniref:hypothetical protein n=1 Tax=Actinoplanes sp. NPDC049118 TaxID=3155769 RepID=UPI0033CE7641